MPSLLTLNVSNPPRERAEALLHWLWPRDEEVWVLTEVGRGAGSGLLLSVCRAAGFDVHVTDRSELGVMTVARVGSWERAELAPPPLLPGRVDSLVWQPNSAGSGEAALRLLATYGAASDPVRYSSKTQRERKRQWLTAYDRVVGEWTAQGERGIVLGDLNLVDPVHEAPLKYVLPEETATYHALSEAHGLVDAFRVHHPDEAAISWMDHSGVGCRYDHAFVTTDLVVEACDLLPEPRTKGLTDHSALTVTIS
ncbi:hypothetical protein [Knoellia sinensis]|uniref:hypothetical protein n=1 Tax=Knoellia sinensis TaxID=136100 RepID=UPI0012EB5291|nr:hypothetical protein [Knoellia sinensis]